MSIQGVQRTLPGLDAIAFMHPSDRAILAKLHMIPLLDTLVGSLVDEQKRQIEVGLLASSIRVTSEMMPALFEIHKRACNILCLPNLPPLYVQQDPIINAYTTGCDEPYVCITSAAVSTLSGDELLYILGHELGHVMAGHVRYSTLAWLLLNLGRAGSVAGVASLAADITVLPLLLMWRRRSEYTADRAGLLVCQDPEVAYRATMILAGYSASAGELIPTKAFLKQADDFEAHLSNSMMDNVYDFINTLRATHPHTVHRASELRQWICEAGFEELVEATERERQQLAARVDQDPRMAELVSLIEAEAKAKASAKPKSKKADKKGDKIREAA